MRLAAILWAVATIPAAAQTFQIGTPSDGCTEAANTEGGPLTVVGSTATFRYGADFTCTFPVSTEGLYTVGLQFLEPCAQSGACAAGQVTQPGQRVENVLINDQPVLWGYDPYRDIYLSAPVSPPTTTGQRVVLVYSHFSQIVVHVQTVVRSGVLSAVQVAPFPVPQTIARSQCIGSGPGYNCAGIELWKINGSAFVAVAATPSMISLPLCPANQTCWKPAALP